LAEGEYSEEGCIMGEIADMMLDGILDANGEYTGRNYGHPVYPKGWFGKKKFVNSAPAVFKVQNFMSQRGIPKGEQQKQALEDYKSHVGCERPTNHTYSNWPIFKAFIDGRIGYIKPSKL